MGGWLPVLLVHESQVRIRALGVLLGDHLLALGHASRSGCRLVVLENETLVTPVAILFFFVLFHIRYAAQFIIALTF